MDEEKKVEIKAKWLLFLNLVASLALARRLKGHDIGRYYTVL